MPIRSPDATNQPPDPVADTSGRTQPSRGRGLLLGWLVGVVFLLAVLANPEIIWRDPTEEVLTSRVGLTFWGTALAIPFVGYVVAIVLTARRATTRVGQGMLRGITLAVRGAVPILYGLFMSRSA